MGYRESRSVISGARLFYSRFPTACSVQLCSLVPLVAVFLFPALLIPTPCLMPFPLHLPGPGKKAQQLTTRRP